MASQLTAPCAPLRPSPSRASSQAALDPLERGRSAIADCLQSNKKQSVRSDGVFWQDTGNTEEIARLAVAKLHDLPHFGQLPRLLADGQFSWYPIVLPETSRGWRSFS